MRRRYLGFALLSIVMLPPAASGSDTSLHGGEHRREIKALSAEEVAGLRAGRGMRMALAAELNGYPGPLHVLELAERLSLSAGQLAATRALHAGMASKAQAFGGELIAAERRLDRLFAAGDAMPAGVLRATAEIARITAELRAAHLDTHIAQRALLNPDQIALYARERGYATDGHGAH